MFLTKEKVLSEPLLEESNFVVSEICDFESRSFYRAQKHFLIFGGIQFLRKGRIIVHFYSNRNLLA